MADEKDYDRTLDEFEELVKDLSSANDTVGSTAYRQVQSEAIRLHGAMNQCFGELKKLNETVDCSAQINRLRVIGRQLLKDVFQVNESEAEKLTKGG